MILNLRTRVSVKACLWILVCLVALGQGVAGRESPERSLELGQSLWEASEYVSAIEYFTDALEGFRSARNRYSEADALQRLGMCYEDLGHFDEASLHYTQALEIFVQLQARDEQGFCHVCLGWTCLGLALPEEAFQHFEEAYTLFTLTQNDQGLQDSLRSLGEALTNLSDESRMRGDPGAVEQLADAIPYFVQALTYYDQTGDQQGKAYCLLSLGRCLLAQGDEDAGKDRFDEAQEIFRQIGDRGGEMNAVEQLALIYESLSRWAEAVVAYDEVLDIAIEIDDRGQQANTRLCIANCLISMEHYDEAESMLGEALDAFRRLSDLDGEIECMRSLAHCYTSAGDLGKAIEIQREAADHAGQANMRLLRADILCDLSHSLSVTGAFQDEIDTLEEARSIYQEEEDMHGIARTLASSGFSYAALASYSMALSHFEAAYEISSAGGFETEEATSLLGIGVCYEGQGEDDKAITYYERALEIQVSQGDYHNIAWCRFSLSNILLARGDVAQAVLLASDALEGFRQFQDSFGIQAALTGLGQCERQLRNLIGARDYLEEAFEVASSIGALHEMWAIEWSLASLAWELGDIASAQTYFESCLARAESLLEKIEVESLIQSYLGRVSEIYTEYLRFQLQTDQPEGTLLTAERCRARTFLDSLVGENRIDLSGIPETGIRARIIDAEAIDQDVAEIVASLPPRTAAIEYMVTDEQIYAWVIQDGVVCDPNIIRISRSSLQTLVIKFREMIEEAGGGVHGIPDNALFSLSRGLYQLLIAPLLNELEDVDHLIIVPSGPLYYLPFAALLNCLSCAGVEYLAGQYLCETYSLSYAPSLATLKHVRESVQGLETSYLALADPDSGNPLIPRLPEAAEEATAIRAILEHGEVHVGTAASEQILRAQAGDVLYLLLSSHGVFDPSNPMNSYLQLAPSPGTDGKLHTYEVFELSLSADLVTLSACETLLPALGDARASVRRARGLSDLDAVELDSATLDALTSGDEIVGLTRAFIYAGTSSVLSTLWNVSSGPTRDLMIQLYTYLADGWTKAEALRQAQLDVMASYPHPRFWAAFNLIGDWR